MRKDPGSGEFSGITVFKEVKIGNSLRKVEEECLEMDI